MVGLSPTPLRKPWNTIGVDIDLSIEDYCVPKHRTYTFETQ